MTPRCRAPFSIAIQSERACREDFFALTEPARWIARAYSRSFSVRVVLPESGWLMIANVRRRPASASKLPRFAHPAEGVMDERGRL
jgi:hypothetical protein